MKPGLKTCTTGAASSAGSGFRVSIMTIYFNSENIGYASPENWLTVPPMVYNQFQPRMNCTNSESYKRAISTVVAHFLHTEGVTGSNPVSPIPVTAKVSVASENDLKPH
jgi:hypothetical protein